MATKPILIALLTLAAAVIAMWLTGTTDGPSLPESIQKEIETVEGPNSRSADVERSKIKKPSGDEPDSSNWSPNSFRLRVVRDEDGTPVPGCAVYYSQREIEDDFVKVVMFTRRVRSHVITGDDGVAKFGIASRVATVFVRHQGLFGLARIESRDKHEVQTLRLVPGRTLRVRTVNADGEPADAVWVQLEFGHPGSRSGCAVGYTKDGVIEWPEFGVCAQNFDLQFEVQATLVGHQPISVDLVPAPVGDTEIELRLPALGAVSVKMLDPLGRPAVGQWGVNLRGHAIDPESGEFSEFGARTGAKLRSGFARFPSVPLDKIFTARVYHSSETTSTEEFAGPTATQPKVEVTLQLPDNRLVLIGRAIDQSGDPIPGARIWLDSRESRHRLVSMRTDRDGRFMFVGPDPAEISGDEAVYCRLDIDRDLPGLLEADFKDYWQPSRPRVLDVGDLVFGPPPILVAGRVIAAPDAPCHNFRIHVEHRTAGAKWRRIEPVLQIDRDTFRSFAETRPGEYRLVVTPVERCHIPPEPIEFVPGSADLEIRLERGHTVEARVRTPIEATRRWSSVHLIRFRLKPTGGEALQRVSQRFGISLSGCADPIDGAHVLFWNGVVEGTYRLEATLDYKREILSIEDIQVPRPDGGPVSIDVDLSEFLREVMIRVLGPDGELAPLANIFLLREGQWANSYTKLPGTTHRAELRGLIVPGEFDLWVGALGYAPVLIHNIATDQDIHLRKAGGTLEAIVVDFEPVNDALGVRVVANSQVHSPPSWGLDGMDDRTWHGRWLRKGWPKRVAGAVDRDGRAKLELQRPGLHKLSVEIYSRSSDISARIDDTSPTEIDLPASDRRTVRMRIPAEALQRALRELEAQKR